MKAEGSFPFSQRPTKKDYLRSKTPSSVKRKVTYIKIKCNDELAFLTKIRTHILGSYTVPLCNEIGLRIKQGL
jgi:hypothetical protein